LLIIFYDICQVDYINHFVVHAVSSWTAGYNYIDFKVTLCQSKLKICAHAKVKIDLTFAIIVFHFICHYLKLTKIDVASVNF
jgi:hypothetical protein